MKLGVLGGTFDPVHHAHVDLARSARLRLGLDAVHLLPCRRSPHKQRSPVAPGSDRLAMIALAVMEHEGLVPDSFELERPAPSFTIDTLRALAAARPGARLYFIMGMDSFRDLRLWKEHEALVNEFDLVVVNRPGAPLPADDEVPPAARGRMVEAAASATAGDPRIHLLEMPPRDIASTAIRRLVSAGEPVGDLVPAAVESYIHRCHLYR